MQAACGSRMQAALPGGWLANAGGLAERVARKCRRPCRAGGSRMQAACGSQMQAALPSGWPARPPAAGPSNDARFLEGGLWMRADAGARQQHLRVTDRKKRSAAPPPPKKKTRRPPCESESAGRGHLGPSSSCCDARRGAAARGPGPARATRKQPAEAAVAAHAGACECLMRICKYLMGMRIPPGFVPAALSAAVSQTAHLNLMAS